MSIYEKAIKREIKIEKCKSWRWWKNENQKKFKKEIKTKARNKFRKKQYFVGKVWDKQNKMTQIGSNGYKLLKSESNHESEEGIYFYSYKEK